MSCAIGIVDASPVGRLGFAVREETLLAIAFDPTEDELFALLTKRFPGEPALRGGREVARVEKAFDRYFAGALGALDALTVDPSGTDFQRSVWRALREIPAGETRSYGEIARRLGNPKAMRAVGLANGQNPIALAIPCHRVIGADGSLTGYGGGMERKRWLLSHERVPGMNAELAL